MGPSGERESQDELGNVSCVDGWNYYLDQQCRSGYSLRLGWENEASCEKRWQSYGYAACTWDSMASATTRADAHLRPVPVRRPGTDWPTIDWQEISGRVCTDIWDVYAKSVCAGIK
jgi:hypothetical protein